jgi:hypothetical protein
VHEKAGEVCVLKNIPYSNFYNGYSLKIMPWAPLSRLCSLGLGILVSSAAKNLSRCNRYSEDAFADSLLGPTN